MKYSGRSRKERSLLIRRLGDPCEKIGLCSGVQSRKAWMSLFYRRGLGGRLELSMLTEKLLLRTGSIDIYWITGVSG